MGTANAAAVKKESLRGEIFFADSIEAKVQGSDFKLVSYTFYGGDTIDP